MTCPIITPLTKAKALNPLYAAIVLKRATHAVDKCVVEDRLQHNTRIGVLVEASFLPSGQVRLNEVPQGALTTRRRSSVTTMRSESV